MGYFIGEDHETAQIWLRGNAPNKAHTSKVIPRSSIYISKSMWHIPVCFGLSTTKENQSSRIGIARTLPTRQVDLTFLEKSPFRAMSPAHG